MEGHFRYEGTVEPHADGDCRACVSAAAKMCITKPSDPNHKDATCGLCAAVKKGRCELHGRGLKAALDEHKMPDQGSQKRYDAAKVAILAEAEGLGPTVGVRVDYHCSDLHDPAAYHPETHAESSPQGGHPKQARLEFTQLDLGRPGK